VIGFVVGTAILSPKSETNLACFLGGFASGSSAFRAGGKLAASEYRRKPMSGNPDTSQPTPGKGMATASMVLGIVSVIPCLALATAPTGLILGIISLKKLKAAGQQTGKAVAGIALSCAFLAAGVPMLGITSAIAIPALMVQRDRARDTACVGNAEAVSASLMRAIMEAGNRGLDWRSVPAMQANVINTNCNDSLAPELFTAKNPYDPTLDGCNRALIAETNEGGANTRTAASAASLGQVRIGFIEPKSKESNGTIVVAVRLMRKRLGTDQSNVYCYIQPL
jgi:type II secretory pathway pseudopilin PulG